MSWHTCAPSDHHYFWHYFCSDFSHPQIFGDNLLNTVLFLFSFPADLRSFEQSTNDYLILTHCFICSTLNSVQPFLASSLTSLCIFLNFMCLKKTCVCDMVLSPYNCWSISSVCDGVFLKWTQNSRFIRSSVVIDGQSGEEGVKK